MLDQSIKTDIASYELKSDNLFYEFRNKAEIIGRDFELDILMSSIPIFSKDNLPFNFREISKCREDGQYSVSQAFLISGEEGSGRHTVEEVFIKEMYDSIYEMDSTALKGCKIYNFELLDIISGDASQKDLNEFFIKLKEKCTENKEYLCIISLGDITKYITKKKNARYLTNVIDSFLIQSDIHIIFSAIIDSKKGEVPDVIFREFTVININNPDFNERKQFWEKLKKDNVNINIDMETENFSEHTDGFNYRKLNMIKEFILMLAKRKLLTAEMNIDNFVYNIKSSDNVNIDTKDINKVIDNVSIVTKKKTTKQPKLYSYPIGDNEENESVNQLDLNVDSASQNDSPIEINENNEDLDDFAEMDDLYEQMQVFNY